MTDTKIKTIGAGALVAIAAGLAAALLFVLAARGSFITFALGYFAPMPVMIAALGFGLSIGAAAALVGGAFIGYVFHPVLAVVYLASIGGPAALIAAAALLAPPRDDRRGRDLAPTFALLATALVAIVTISGGIVYMAWRNGGFAAMIDMAANEARPLIEEMLKSSRAPGSINADQLARYMVFAAPIGVAASELITMSVNLWLAGRVSLISGSLPRAWPSLADDLAIPPLFGALFAAACGLVFLGGLPGAVSGVFAAAFGSAFALQGLAVAHVLTRGSSMRPALLFMLYAFIVLLPPWPFMLLAIVGLADAAFHLRTRKSATPDPIS